MIEHRYLIEKLGGPKALTVALSNMAGAAWEYEAVRKWARRGIPWRARPLVARLAAEHGIQLPEDFLGSPVSLLSPTPPRTPAAAGRLEQPREDAAAEGRGQGHRKRNGF